MPCGREIVIVSSTAASAELLLRLPDASWPEQPAALGRDATLGSIAMELPRAAYRTAAVG